MNDPIDITVLRESIARVPRHLGFNVEIQEHHDTINLWDWIVDSNSTVLREFHPETVLRKRLIAPPVWEEIRTREDFECFRKRVAADPVAGGIQWHEFLFEKELPWFGVPDRVIGSVTAMGVEPLIGLNYGPAMYHKRLVNNADFVGVPDDSQIDWSAAAGAYDYYFGVIYHYTKQFSCRYYMMVNEPEFRWGWFYLPGDLQETLGEDWFPRLFRQKNNDDLRKRYFDAISTQYMVMAQLARMALEDVRALLSTNPAAPEMVLSGPTTGKWEAYWETSSPYFDFFDYHHYSTEPGAFRSRYSRVASVLKGSDKLIAISEFNRRAGEMELTGFYFTIENSIGFADILMEVMALAAPPDPLCEFACVYLLNFPATHRNYKQLLYGDMNLLDWTGTDQRLWDKGDEWHPTSDEMQVRFATPAYYFFRMLARCAGRGCPRERLPRALRSPVTTPDSAVAPEICDKLKVLTVDTGELLYVNILNAAGDSFESVTLDLAQLPRRFRWAVVRVSSRLERDKVRAQHRLTSPSLNLSLDPQSLTQVIFTGLDLDEISTVSIREQTFTPGTCASLGLWQTTRLRAFSVVNDRELDITELNAIWSSSRPWVVRADQSGLVQRMRSSHDDATVTVTVPDGAASASVRIPADL